MKGALACYVEAVRALRDAGVRLRGDVMIAAVAARSRRRSRATRRAPSTAATRPARATSSPTAASPTCASSASRPRARSCSRHFGSLWLRHLDARHLHPHRLHARAARGELDPAHARGARRACSSGSRRWEEDRDATAAPKAIVNVGAIQGGFGWRVSRTPHRDRPLPRPARAADEARWRVARREALDMVRALRSASPTTGSRARST